LVDLAGYRDGTCCRRARDKRELATIDSSLSMYPVVPFSESIGVGAYQLLKTYAKSHALGVFDSLVAASALEQVLTLVTLDRKHYQMIKGLLLEVPDYQER
jgi:predicted nucleic acid-binding protein